MVCHFFSLPPAQRWLKKRERLRGKGGKKKKPRRKPRKRSRRKKRRGKEKLLIAKSKIANERGGISQRVMRNGFGAAIATPMESVGNV